MAVYKFSQGARNGILMADRICKNTNCKYTGTEHVLAGLLSTECIARNILLDANVDIDAYFKLLALSKDNNYQAIGYTPRAKNMFETANNFANITNGGFIGTEHLLIGVISDSECVAMKILERLGINPLDILRGVENELGMNITINVKTNLNQQSPLRDFTKMAEELFKTVPLNNQTHSASPNSHLNVTNREVNQRDEKGDANIKFGDDLTKKAREGKLDPVIGREKEIERIIQILSRRTKNNPVLVGEPGVGKTAVIEGLAEKIVKDQVPEMLKGKTVFSLDIGGMLAGAKYRGDFEERLKEFLDTVKSRGDVIIFIDEIHNIVGAGGTAESGMDAAEILKPMLARGELQTIGATTIDEYRKYIEKDSALERRFQPVQVDQPNVEDTIKILKGLRDKYEAHHKISITDEAIKAAAELADRYITDRFMPDKAIDLIDEAASRARLDTTMTPPDFKEITEQIELLENEKLGFVRKNDFDEAGRVQKEIVKLKSELKDKEEKWEASRGSRKSSIGAEEVASIVSLWTHVPVQKLTQTEAEKLMNLESILHSRVVGQDDAVKAISRAIRRARAGLKDPKRPIGSFIFVGPTGVGKTELSKALAEAVFGDENLMIRVDMSEFMEKHSVSKLVGAPPGYVGFDENGQLTEKVRRKPYSVILFDEIEKAHPDVFNILLQILEDGRLTDSKGRVVDFKNTIIIMTSNVGAQEIAKITSIGFGTLNTSEIEQENMKEKIMDALKSSFKPEFLNRIDEIIVFQKLKVEEIAQICTLMINALSARLSEKGIDLNFTEKARETLVSSGFDAEYGARPLRRAIQRMVEDKLSEEILKGTIAFGDKVKVDGENGELKFVKM